MAALTYPISVIPERRLRVVEPIEAGRASEMPRIVSIVERRRRRAVLARRRRLAALLLSALVLGATWGMANVLSGLRSYHLVELAGSVPTTSGYLYKVQPGDTVWSIASRIDPSGDPRPIVAEIDAPLHGATIVPGERILVP